MNNQGSKFDNGIQIPYNKLYYINSSDEVVQFDFESLDLPGTLDVTGATTLDSTLEVDGASQLNSTLTIGEDDTGYDVKLFGATSGSYFLWDESEDKLIINAGTADLGTSCEADAYTVGGVAGIDFDGAVTNLTAVKGIVTAAS